MSANSETITVGLPGRRYEIRIGDGLLASAGQAIAAATGARKCAIVTDEAVAPLHLRALEDSLRRAEIATVVVTLPAGEATKDLAHFGTLTDALLEAEIGRDDVVVALGGGVIGDIAGFAASVLRRGVRAVQIPTTLLAQVDSSVGGKTAIDTRFGKNLLGAFHQPSLVVIDLDVLKTLPPRQMRAGYAEVVKYGLIRDAAFFGWLEENGAAVIAGEANALAHAIAASCRTKAKVVEADERETSGERALLNLGHTFGHAIEVAAGYEADSVLHGEAVAVGMVMAATLSRSFGFESTDRLINHFKKVGLPTTLDDLGVELGADTLYEHMRQDKKVRDGEIAFVLLRAIGEAFVEPGVARETVLAAMRTRGAD